MRTAVLLAAALCAAPAAHPQDDGALRPPEGPQPLPRYPLALGFPDFLARGEPLLLTDIAYSSPQAPGEPNLWRLGVRFKDLGYLRFELQGQTLGVRFTGERLDFSAVGDADGTSLGASYRAAAWLVVSADARTAFAARGRSWIYAPTLQLRPTPDLELYGWLQGDSERPGGRSLTESGAGAVWQRGARLEANLQHSRAYVLTAARDENRVTTTLASLVAQLEKAEITAAAQLEDTSGRFPRQELDLASGLRLPLAARLLLEGFGRGRFDSVAGSLGHSYSGALTWFGRRFTLPRAGRVGSRAVELARQATAAREYELRVFDADALRAQRERLSLSPRAPELREALEASYRALVEERAVPLLGLRATHADDVFTGERTTTAGALVGMPWPPAWPWSASEGAVPFLKLELALESRTTGAEFRSETRSAALTLELNRELDLVARYRRAEPTALDVILGRGVDRRLVVSFVYARGR